MVGKLEGSQAGLGAEVVGLVVDAAGHPDPADVPRAERPELVAQFQKEIPSPALCLRSFRGSTELTSKPVRFFEK